ncbi:very-long-chain 3-ketoacyl-CoA synthase [Aureococcus anophagefferens]|nr:very-long-chain 3-ketoacyl-CoA synthase [Aureococcus anophagefferens]
MGSLLRAWLDLEQRFHPHVAATSPFRVSTADFLGAMWLPRLRALRTAPILLGNLRAFPFRRSLCHAAADDWGRGAAGLWVQLFILSKFAELADTAFIVLRKKRLLFLHWYHHLTVLLYCWHSYATEAPHALYFVAMNYAVHSLMYAYYGLMAVDAKPAWFLPEVVTGAQISQMVAGSSCSTPPLTAA